MEDGCFSDWKLVSSGVPLGLLLEPLLFVLYIDSMDTKVQGMIHKFTDDKIAALWITKEG